MRRGAAFAFLAFLAGLALAMSMVTATDADAQSQPSAERFSNAAVTGGVTITRKACAALEAQHTAAWVEVDGRGECLRYYAAGLRPAPGPNPIAAAWMHGDIMGTKPTSVGHQEGLGVASMIDQERALAERFGIPFLFLARPGAYGSSGRFWTTRHTPREAALMNALLDVLKARYGVAEWALGGHSAGGTLTAEFLARRHDLRCAVISSGAPAYRAYLEARGLRTLLARPQGWFDPAASLDRIPPDPERRVFVIGDPRETNIPFDTQRGYFDALTARGHAAWLVPLERAPAPRHHSLVDFGETALGLCGSSADSGQIVATLKAMPDQRERISN
ncbi:alpha/beta hydrolase family protein [Azospirillum brasilense]|uniref:alpha/beta hydrolase family protein n=1 Tax=Azospirillum brasilense TaxID=192 RepID=UPI000E69EA19|nr:alpha/beta hydrolase [Azospirillum brasilense]NUB23911.1 alpha/beta hydrolase [Azospirillum brasilense]NUB32319.1 alpha/beta hydrolase [Azospirillum brasilense]RIW00085.1 alpha/beta hydrolase [Azospirillum brasilense]